MHRQINISERHLASWLLCSSGDDALLQLLHASQTSVQCIILKVDMAPLMYSDSILYENLLYRFAETQKMIENVANHFLSSPLFLLPNDLGAVEKFNVTVRLENLPMFPGSSKPHLFSPGQHFVPFSGFIVACQKPQVLGKSDPELFKKFKTMEIQTLQIVLIRLDLDPKIGWRFSYRNQECLVLVDHELVKQFACGQLVIGTGRLTLGDINDSFKRLSFEETQTLLKRSPSSGLLGTLMIHANTITLLNNLPNEHYRFFRELKSSRYADDCAQISKVNYWRQVLTAINNSEPQDLPNCNTFRSQLAFYWKTTMNLLKEFAHGVVNGRFDKIKLLLLLSLVSEPKPLVENAGISSFKNNATLGYVIDNFFTKRVAGAASLHSAAHTYDSWRNGVEDQSEFDDAISILIVSEDPRISRLVEWASQFYPLRTKLTMFASQKHVLMIPQGSLLIVKGTTLAKRSHFDQLKNSLTRGKMGGSRASIVWCVYPNPSTTTSVRIFETIVSQNLFQSITLSSKSAMATKSEDDAAEADDILDCQQGKQCPDSASAKFFRENLVNVSIEHVNFVLGCD
uniref:Uncharacterized protein n=1 Tax=Spongospora subterranea TaxID=70186 RepID=A0A0H5R7X7_9EUKA|eukprot:CRZ04389.1 hypothetical protein [Spongospora subterranea]